MLKFFSQLTGIDMLDALKSGFSEKRFENILFWLGALMVYLITFVMFLAIILSPISMSTAIVTQKGGLLGYESDNNIYNYYDPLQERYLQIVHYNPPPTTDRFDETLSIVSFYRAPFDDYYQNVLNLSYFLSLIKFIFLLIGAIPLYFMLLVIAKEYGRQSNTAIVISHKLIADNFKEITKIDFLMAVFILLILIGVITVIGSLISRRIVSKHEKVYGVYSNEYRTKIMQIISPGKKITGRVIRREKDVIEQAGPRIRYKDSERLQKSSLVRVPIKVYTVEFRNILHFPVYLDISFVDDEDAKKYISKLDSLFVSDKSSVTIDKNDMEFIVSENYGIFLPEDK